MCQFSCCSLCSAAIEALKCSTSANFPSIWFCVMPFGPADHPPPLLPACIWSTDKRFQPSPINLTPPHNNPFTFYEYIFYWEKYCLTPSSPCHPNPTTRSTTDVCNTDSPPSNTLPVSPPCEKQVQHQQLHSASSEH